MYVDLPETRRGRPFSKGLVPAHFQGQIQGIRRFLVFDLDRRRSLFSVLRFVFFNSARENSRPFNAIRLICRIQLSLQQNRNPEAYEVNEFSLV